MQELRVGIVGLGYVGLALVDALCKSGIQVVGFDKDDVRIDKLISGHSPNESMLDLDLRNYLDLSMLKVSCDANELKVCDVVVIAVPTPLDKSSNPDYSFLEAACEAIASNVKSDVLLINESTSHPGTLREVIIPIFRRIRQDSGEGISFACSPERVNPGDLQHNIRNTPRVVSGIDEKAKKAVCDFYSIFVDKVHLAASPEVAEMSKLLENSFRLVNIAFINEINNYCLRKGISLRQVIEAASTKPFGFMAFTPGAGVGGHCIPVDPEYLLRDAKSLGVELGILETSARSNRTRAIQIIEFLSQKFGNLKDKRILLEGLTYKSNIRDLRESPSVELLQELKDIGVKNIKWSDPLIQEFAGFAKGDLNQERFDLILLLVAHNNTNLDQIEKSGSIVVDFTGKIPSNDQNVFHF